MEFVLGTIPPGITAEEVLWERGMGGVLHQPSQIQVEIRFTDSAGRRWRRDWKGRLHRFREVMKDKR
jgi:hypothetical protein